MGSHKLIEMWKTFRDVDRPDPSTLPSPDYFRQGLDYLSLVSNIEFENFMRAQLSSDEIQKTLGFSDVIGWLTSSSSNNPSSAARIKDRTLYTAIRFPLFIDRLRLAIWKSISDILLNTAADGVLPEAGSILYFTEELTFAYVIKYHLHYERPVVEIIDRLTEPKGLLEIESINRLRTHRARNTAKNYLTSGHKIVMQRGVLTHVDRRLDKNVFGPTIDTLLLADILARSTDLNSVETFLEIGSGNGHISSTVASLCPSLKNIVTIDLSEHATACTIRNVRANIRYFHPGQVGIDKLRHFYSVFGRFDGNIFNTTFDLIVSNPPYIMAHDNFDEDFAERYTQAVGGTELIEKIFETIPELVSPSGRVLLMTSSASGNIEQRLPANFQCLPAGTEGVEIPFEVEAVLDEAPWLERLVDQGVVRTNGVVYTHTAKPIWIQHTS